MFDVNIVIVNYHNKDDVARAVTSILQDGADSPLYTHITVVDNSCNRDGIREALATFGNQVRYVTTLSNVGYGRGCNFGFKTIPARYHFIFNPDNTIAPGSKAIERLVKFMDNNPAIAAVGPKLVYPNGDLQYTCCRFDRPSIMIKPFKQIGWDKKYAWVKKQTDWLLMKDFNHQAIQPVDWVIGSAILMRAEVLEKVGFFDERYFMYLEDCDLCQKFWEHGSPVYYFPEVTIIHRYVRESAEVPGVFSAILKNKLARAHLVSWIKYLWKWRKLHKYYV